jgi:hypothetical protein
VHAQGETLDLIQGYYEAIDSGRLDDCERFFTPDATLRIAHFPEIAGRETIVQVVRNGLANPNVSKLTHEVRNAWEEDDGTVIFEVHAHYELADGNEVVVPGVVIAETEDGRFRSQRIAADLSPVYGKS